jgi:hypothetical protein
MIFFPTTVASLRSPLRGSLRLAVSLRSARSTVITRFIATMMALTSVYRLTTFLRKQISCVHGTFLA